MAARVTLLNLPQVLEAIQHGRWKVLHLEPVLSGPVADAVREFFKKRFDTEGSYGGNAWAPLSMFSQHPAGKGILRITDALYESLTEPGGEGYQITTDGSLILGSAVEYGKYHQTGTETMPARQIIPDEVPAADLHEWASLIVDYLMTGRA